MALLFSRILQTINVVKMWKYWSTKIGSVLFKFDLFPRFHFFSKRGCKTVIEEAPMIIWKHILCYE